MKKWHIWAGVLALLFVIGSCNAETNNSGPATNLETTQPSGTIALTPNGTNHTENKFEEDSSNHTIPTLDNADYWKVVRAEIIEMLHQHNLYVSHIDTRYPYINISVEPGMLTGDGKIVAKGLTEAEYIELYQCIKEELYKILDKYKLAKPKTIFHGCHSIVGIFCYNWFYDDQVTPKKVISQEVARYQIDLLEYYYDREGDSYIRMEGMSEALWTKYPIYVP